MSAFVVHCVLNTKETGVFDSTVTTVNYFTLSGKSMLLIVSILLLRTVEKGGIDTVTQSAQDDKSTSGGTKSFSCTSGEHTAQLLGCLLSLLLHFLYKSVLRNDPVYALW